MSLGVLIIIGALPAWSQATSSSTVTGQVTDQQSAVIPGVEVKLVDTATGTVKSTTSNETGRYVFVNVPSGTYTITFSKQGFTAYRVGGQQVVVGSTLTVNAMLEVGTTATTVEVTASKGADLQTTNASVGNTISGEALIALPNLGRDVSTLAVLQPGVTLGGFTAGAYEDQNTFMLDGGNATDDMSGESNRYATNFTGLGGTQQGAVPSGVVPTPVESIEEFHVSTFNQTPDFNSSIGSQIQMVTKRGTNQWHGSGYWYYYATNVGAANTWHNNHTPFGSLPYTPLFSNHRNRFGGSLGGPLTPKILGGKTFFFVNYEGLRYPNVNVYERPVPSDLMRLGVIQIADSGGKYQAYNLNPYPVTYQGTTYQPAMCPGGLCDPRGLGINPIVQKIWSYMPKGNDPYYASNGADGYNVVGYQGSLATPLTSNSYVARVDHDFGDKWRLFATYRYMRLNNVTNNQVDIGGLLGGTMGQMTPLTRRPQIPSYMVYGLTTNITPAITNDFRFNYTRNFWQWFSAADPAQLPGLGGAVEIASGYSQSNAESSTCNYTLIPYNVSNQCTRTRFWDGQDKLLRDDLTMIKGNHLFQFGGQYQRNYDNHMRTDNGLSINNQVVYQVASSGISFPTSWMPAGLTSSGQSAWRNLSTEVLGMVSQSQVIYTRTGSSLTVRPIGEPAYEQSVIPFYNVYASDTWRIKPSFTLTYGMGWMLQMPPYELTGKQVVAVDQYDDPIVAEDYLANRKKAALAGQVYNPVIGFSLVPNIGKGMKYPYDPFYGAFSPRVSAAWNPKFASGILGKLFGDGRTVLRGGYGRIYGRLNGVNLVLVPLLGVGPLQPVACLPGMNGQCLSTGSADPTNVFRIGTDGMVAPLPGPSPTLPQPYLSGYQGTAAAGDVNTLDPHYRPERTDNVTFSLQRELRSKMMLEVGYMGRLIRNEMQEVNIDAVPYMTTLSGQSFAQAYANVYTALVNAGTPAGSVAAQPFFEAALGGTGTYCKGYANCTAAVASKLTSSIKTTSVSDVWANINKADSWTLGRTMISGAGPGISSYQATSLALTTSLGSGNYNALYFTYKVTDFHGLTAVSNFTWGRALGTATLAQANSGNTTLDPWNPHANYGLNNFDIKFLYNLAMYYQAPYFRTQKGVLGHLLGGWTISPLFTAQSGSGIYVGYNEQGPCGSGCQAFGESSSSSISSTAEGAVGAAAYTGGSTAHYNNPGANGVGTNNPEGINLFAHPDEVIKEFRPCVLGIDTSCGGYYNARGLPRWNLDATVQKDIGVWKEGRVGAALSVQFTNILNHMDPSNPSSLNINSASTFGRITGQSNVPRQMEFGMRIHF